MFVKNDSENSTKVRRFYSKKNIHSLHVFNKAGICLYTKDFTNYYKIEQKQLVSSFFTALMSFAKEIIGNKVKTVEMKGVKFVIFEKSSYYYCLLCDSIENIVLLDDITSKINDIFINYVIKNNVNTNIEYIYDNNLNELMDESLKYIFSTEFDLQMEQKIIGFLNDLSQPDEIKGVILLTDKGEVIFSTLMSVNLRNLLKEVDFRVKICNNSILKLFYTSKNSELIFSDYIADLYFVILVFDLKTKFGITEYYLQKVVKFVKTYLNLVNN